MLPIDGVFGNVCQGVMGHASFQRSSLYNLLKVKHWDVSCQQDVFCVVDNT